MKPKQIARVQLKSATVLKPLDMNKIHFGGLGSAVQSKAD